VARTISIMLKIRSSGNSVLKFDDKIVHNSYEGIASVNDNTGSSGYIDMLIDIDTGQILNWKKPNENDISEMVSQQSEEYDEETEEGRKLNLKKEDEYYSPEAIARAEEYHQKQINDYADIVSQMLNNPVGEKTERVKLQPPKKVENKPIKRLMVTE